MKSTFRQAFFISVFLVLPLTLFAGDFMAEGNSLFDKGKTNYESYKQSGDMFAKALEVNPSSYEAAWKAARSYRYFADESKKRNVTNWKAICKEYGKIGMTYGERAIVLDPDSVEGNIWYGFSVASYADSVSVLTVLREGLKDKTQSSFERAYKANKMYNNGGPVKALGRFWFVLPWPLQDKQLSLQYLREFQKAFPDDPEGQVYIAETLTKTGNKDEAKKFLQKASISDDKYYSD
jgi:tetratricopeptide (TPR) repeat protein